MKRFLLAAGIFWMSFGCLYPQVSSSGVQYFQPGYAYRHTLNPALVPQWGYVGFPAVGNINVGLASNLGIADFLYPLNNGKVGTFLHPEVTPARFLKNIRRKNYININLDMDVLSAGWFWGRSFWSFDIRLKAGVQLTAPYEFFEFLKKGMDKNPASYNIKDMGMQAQAYTEFAIGYARDLNERWSVGGKFKFLVGAVSASLSVRDMQIYLSDEEWKVNSNADLHVFGRLLDVDFPDDGDFSLQFGELSPAGYGIAVDLGMEFRPGFIKGLRFSASVLDLGFLCYNQESVRKYEAQGGVSFTGFENLGTDVDLNGAIEDLTDDVLGMLDFKEVPVYKNYVKRVMPTLNFAVEYGFWGNRFSVGLLSSTTFYALHPESELSVVGNIHPARWFSVSLAYAFLGNRRGLGWAVNITPKYGLNLFIASNYTPLYVNNSFIPLKRAHANVQVGLTFAIGNNRRYTFGASDHDNNAFPYTYRHPERNRPNRYEMFMDADDATDDVYGNSWWDDDVEATPAESVPVESTPAEEGNVSMEEETETDENE
ncbi:hypothetical protein HDR62_04295 [bacterium]|nr:hypothetical protein [bacterium]